MRSKVGEHLEKRNGVLMFRRALPRALQAASGVREFVRRLPTEDVVDAKRMRDALVEALDIGWAAALTDMEADTYETRAPSAPARSIGSNHRSSGSIARR